MFSTETALLEAANEWHCNIDSSLVNGVIFLDLEKLLIPWITLSSEKIIALKTQN